MGSRSATGVLALLFSLLVPTASTSASAEDKTPARYPTPNAVFDAYRDARAKREWRTVFSTLTFKVQNDVVFECFFGCMEHGAKADGLVIQEYLKGDIGGEYEKRYKQEYGGHEHDPNFTPPPSDRDLLRDVVAEHVKDKAGFFDAVEKLHVDTIRPLGDLTQVAIKGNTATGRTKITHIPRLGESPTPAGQATNSI